MIARLYALRAAGRVHTPLVTLRATTPAGEVLTFEASSYESAVAELVAALEGTRR